MMMSISEVLARLNATLSKPPFRVVLGFDGFIDRIAQHVMGTGSQPYESVGQLGEALSSCEKSSLCLNLTGIRTRAGGNAPNTALALQKMGAQCCLIGALGYPSVDRAFLPLEESGARVLTYAQPGACLSLEMKYGKLFLADNGGMESISPDEAVSRVGRHAFLNEMDGCDALALLNWGEVPEMDAFWRMTAQEMMPALKCRPRVIMTDAADLSRRNGEELNAFVKTMSLLRPCAPTLLSVNEGEFLSLARWAGIRPDMPHMDAVREVRSALGIHTLVLHTRQAALAVTPTEEAELQTRQAEHPMLQTGGGDNFNAGYLFGHLAGLDARGCLMTGNAASSRYIRRGACASLADLIAEIRLCEHVWPD